MKKDKETLIKNAVKSLMTMFQTAEFPAQLTQTIIRRNAEDVVPSDAWSLANRALILSQGSSSTDARGYKQWEAVGRNVIKGSKAIYIFAPCTKKIKDKDELTGEESEKIILVGFRPIPVFKYEDTDGTPLPEFDYKPKIYPNFFDVAEKLNLKVEYRPMQSNFLGRYMSKTKKIELCSQDAVVYFHELAHAVHDTFVDIKRYDKAKAEIVAEFSACVLSELSGQKGYEFQGYEYIKRYCGGEDKPEAVLKKIMGVLNDVEKIVGIILDTTENSF